MYIDWLTDGKKWLTPAFPEPPPVVCSASVCSDQKGNVTPYSTGTCWEGCLPLSEKQSKAKQNNNSSKN